MILRKRDSCLLNGEWDEILASTSGIRRTNKFDELDTEQPLVEFVPVKSVGVASVVDEVKVEEIEKDPVDNKYLELVEETEAHRPTLRSAAFKDEGNLMGCKLKNN